MRADFCFSFSCIAAAASSSKLAEDKEEDEDDDEGPPPLEDIDVDDEAVAKLASALCGPQASGELPGTRTHSVPCLSICNPRRMTLYHITLSYRYPGVALVLWLFLFPFLWHTSSSWFHFCRVFTDKHLLRTMHACHEETAALVCSQGL